MKPAPILPFVSLFVFLCTSLHAQVKVGAVGGTTPHSSAVLDVADTARGLLLPRMSSPKRTAIVAPAQGLIVYDSSTREFYFYQDTA